MAVGLFCFLTGLVIIFQACLAAGLPWGAASMGGKYPGKYPPKMRKIALLNILILLAMASIVLIRAGIILPAFLPFASIAIWVLAAYFVAGTIMNIITPSKIERIWAPVTFIQLVTCVIIAMG